MLDVRKSFFYTYKLFSRYFEVLPIMLLITTCPRCNAKFHITEHHLNAADGLVVCKYCHKVFQAKSSLQNVPETMEEAKEKRSYFTPKNFALLNSAKKLPTLFSKRHQEKPKTEKTEAPANSAKKAAPKTRALRAHALANDKPQDFKAQVEATSKTAKVTAPKPTPAPKKEAPAQKRVITKRFADVAEPQNNQPIPALQQQPLQQALQQSIQAAQQETTPLSIQPVIQPQQAPVQPNMAQSMQQPMQQAMQMPHTQPMPQQKNALAMNATAQDEINWTTASLIALIVLVIQLFYIILQK
ncbi:MAG: hypothetical protein IJR44_00430 [Neisseriaceae bacterium]|nr:hypothetical protein [Neisseriaceae bacterium]